MHPQTSMPVNFIPKKKELRMKKILLVMMTLLSLSFLNSCVNDKDDVAVSKTVVYEASFKDIEGNADLYLKGEYADAAGKIVKVDSKLPFRVELQNVPLTVKSGFKGYIFSIKASQLVGTIQMRVTTQPVNKTVYSNKSDLDLYTNASLGFTGEELIKETSFHFSE